MDKIYFDENKFLNNTVWAYQKYLDFLKYPKIELDKNSPKDIFKMVYWYSYGVKNGVYNPVQHKDVTSKVLSEKYYEKQFFQESLGKSLTIDDNIKLLKEYILLQGDTLLALAFYIMLTDLEYDDEFDTIYKILIDFSLDDVFDKLYIKIGLLMSLVKNEELKRKIISRIKFFISNIKFYPKIKRIYNAKI